MQSPRDIRRRIKSISSTAQITKAMQMVAASKMKKIQEATVAMRPFVRVMYRIQRAATNQVGKYTHPLLQVREVRKRAVILVGTDRGLCGPLNNNLFRLAAQFDPTTTVFITAGRKAAQFIARSQRQLIAEFTFSDTPRLPEARAIAAFACDLFMKGEVDQVLVVATQFVNTLTQNPVCLDYLPVGEIKAMWLPGTQPKEDVPIPRVQLKDEPTDDAPETLFEPGPEAILDYMLSRYVIIYIYQALQNAKASEQSARMVSMKNATDNAEDLIRDLTLEYNKLRQGNITQELLEIAGGQAG
jgi:F-type H+-transporting ATPase subunit gamma